MKKPKPTFRKFLILLTAVWILIPAICLADGQTGGNVPAPTSGSTPGSTPSGGAGVAGTVTVNELLPQFTYTNTSSVAGTKIGAVNALPHNDWRTTLTNIIKLLLNISGGLTLVSFTVGGVMMIISQGNGDLLNKGKQVTYYSIAGLIIIAVSYAVVIGVSELQFFTPGAGGGGGAQTSGSPAATPAAGSTPIPTK